MIRLRVKALAQATVQAVNAATLNQKMKNNLNPYIKTL